MCQLKSAIVLKDRVYCPDHDHHTRMLEELKIKDTRENAERLFVRVELLPADGDIFSPVETWKLCVDQDIKPDWFFEDVERPKVIAVVKAWAAGHIFEGKDGLELPPGGTYYLKNCKDATLYEYSTATLRGNSTATLRENSTATLCGNSTATLWGNSTATLRGNSTGIMPNDCFSGVRNNYVIMDNATLKDCKAKTIYQSGEWRLVEVKPE